MRSDPEFPGHWQDTEITRGHLSLQVAPWLRVWGSATDSEWNVDDDLLRSHPDNAYRSAGVNFQAGPLGKPSVYRRWMTRRNENTGAWDEREQTTVFELHRRFGEISLTAKAEDGERRDLINQTERELRRYGMQFSYYGDEKLELSGGYDSSSIVMAAAELTRHPGQALPEVFTVSQDYPGLSCDEGRYISSVVEASPFPAIRFDAPVIDYSDSLDLEMRKADAPYPETAWGRRTAGSAHLFRHGCIL